MKLKPTATYSITRIKNTQLIKNIWSFLCKIDHSWTFTSDCKIEFYFTEWTPKAVLRVKIQVWVFMSEIKFDLTLKNQISVHFRLLFTIIQLYLLFDSRLDYFLAVSLVLFSLFSGYNIGWQHSFAPWKWAQIKDNIDLIEVDKICIALNISMVDLVYYSCSFTKRNS